MIHLIIIRLEGYSQRSVTMNVFPLQLLRVMLQDKLKMHFVVLIAPGVWSYLNNSYITKAHGKMESSISSAIDVIVGCSFVQLSDH